MTSLRNSTSLPPMKSKVVLTVLASVLLFVVAPAAHAAVTNVAWWRMGENDPGAADGGTTTSTTNLLGGTPLPGNIPAYGKTFGTFTSFSVSRQCTPK